MQAALALQRSQLVVSDSSSGRKSLQAAASQMVTDALEHPLTLLNENKLFAQAQLNQQTLMNA